MKAELREIAWDRLPEDLFAGLCERRGAFFLDSAMEADGLGRYSFIGFDPFLVFRVNGDVISLRRADGEEDFRGDALAELKKLLLKYRCAATSEVPFPGGAVGFFSYEFGAGLEQVKGSAGDDVGGADLELGFYDGLIMCDHKSHRMFLVANPVGKESAAAIFRRLEQVIIASSSRQNAGSAKSAHSGLKAVVSKAEYLQSIARIKNYIAAGDVYQVNLTQRFDAPLTCSPYDLYRRLRQRSPAPFSCFLNFDSLQVVSSSPERFLRLQSGCVETRPIKGTRPRGKPQGEDARLRSELAVSEKDRAELLMIVDLERNDLGRVCVPGSIEVAELYKVETHPTVHHLVANVSGKIRGDCDVVDCIRAMLPGGSITGAPKIRAMQIIDELERTRRGVYTGAIGYIGFDGGCDLNIAIRTILCAHGRAHYHVGGGIVWDSDPEAEYQETLDKGAAMRAALLE
ncbi:MAG: aminodeoxychorismate synthase component I [Verrucomicrobia bacterium]|nr:aminodeoxychorismate synthase component I [Verrucomicrobiota bacterium]